MKVAVCIAGPLGNWKQTGPWWEPALGVRPDIFVHTADPDGEEFARRYDATSFSCHSPPDLREQLSRASADLPHTGHLLTPGSPAALDVVEDFHAIQSVVHAKKCHEVETRADYDAVLFGRGNMVHVAGQFSFPDRDVVQGNLGSRRPWRLTEFSPRYFFSDSPTADKVGALFRALPLIRTGIFFRPEKAIRASTVVHFYLRMIRLQPQQSPVQFKVLLSSEEALERCENNIPFADDETI